jgi:hypothetical protein
MMDKVSDQTAMADRVDGSLLREIEAGRFPGPALGAVSYSAMAREIRTRRAEDDKHEADAALVEHLLECDEAWHDGMQECTTCARLRTACREARKPPELQHADSGRYCSSRHYDSNLNELAPCFICAYCGHSVRPEDAQGPCTGTRPQPPAPTIEDRLRQIGLEVRVTADAPTCRLEKGEMIVRRLPERTR